MIGTPAINLLQQIKYGMKHELVPYRTLQLTCRLSMTWDSYPQAQVDSGYCLDAPSCYPAGSMLNDPMFSSVPLLAWRDRHSG